MDSLGAGPAMFRWADAPDCVRREGKSGSVWEQRGTRSRALGRIDFASVGRPLRIGATDGAGVGQAWVPGDGSSARGPALWVGLCELGPYNAGGS